MLMWPRDLCTLVHKILYMNVFYKWYEKRISHCGQSVFDLKQSFPRGHWWDPSLLFVIAGTHQHNYDHVALGSPTRTPKNGKIN